MSHNHLREPILGWHVQVLSPMQLGEQYPGETNLVRDACPICLKDVSQSQAIYLRYSRGPRTIIYPFHPQHLLNALFSLKPCATCDKLTWNDSGAISPEPITGATLKVPHLTRMLNLAHQQGLTCQLLLPFTPDHQLPPCPLSRRRTLESDDPPRPSKRTKVTVETCQEGIPIVQRAYQPE